MTKRGYQLGFYTSWSGVRDAAARSRKADKILYALRTFSGRSFEEAVCLDVGCSSGLVSVALAPLFARLIGVEYDPVALAAAPRDHHPSVGFVRGDAMCLPLAEASVDVIICAQVYEHVPSDDELAAEVYRVLKPGGVVFFSGPNKLFPIEPHYFLPFLHWLPPRWADRYLRLTGRGTHYYERSRTRRGLRRLWGSFEVQDINPQLLATNAEAILPQRWARWAAKVPAPFWRLLLPFLPNFNWLLFKTRTDAPTRSPVP